MEVARLAAIADLKRRRESLGSAPGSRLAGSEGRSATMLKYCVVPVDIPTVNATLNGIL